MTAPRNFDPESCGTREVQVGAANVPSMPIYLVRWPAFEVSLVRARNEEELIDLLDEVADPGACRWTIYGGPLWIDLDVPIEIKGAGGGERMPRSVKELKLRGLAEISKDGWAYRASIGGGDTKWDMQTAITAWAFPKVAALIERTNSDAPPARALAAAARAELVDMLKYFWRRRAIERRTDREAQLLKFLGLSKAPPWLKKILEERDKT